MKSRFREFMRGGDPPPHDPYAVRQAQYIPATADRPPTRKQVAAMLATPEPCPQELGLSEVCDCRDHRGDPIHGLREFGDQRGRFQDSPPLRPGTTPATSLAYLNERQHEERLQLAARILDERLAREEAGYTPPPPDPQAAIDAMQELAAVMRDQDAQREMENQARIEQMEAYLGGGGQ